MQDKNGKQLNAGDEVILRAEVTGPSSGGVDVKIPGTDRHYWFDPAHLELVPKPEPAPEEHKETVADA